MKPTTEQSDAKDRKRFTELEQLPNVGPSLAASLRSVEVNCPKDLHGRDPIGMYDDLCRVAGRRQDLCVLDVFISVVRLMEGEPSRPWWKYTAERKRMLAVRENERP